MRPVCGDVTGSDACEEATACIQVEPVAWRITLYGHKEVGPAIVVVITPNGIVAVLRSEARHGIGDSGKDAGSVIMIEPIDSIPRHEHIEKAVVVVVGPDASLRAAGGQRSDDANAVRRHLGERAV